jgi:broad specificity phosphatase PhoE
MPSIFYESGALNIEKNLIELDVDNLEGLTYDLIQKAFNEVLEQAGIDPAKVTHEEWTLTCKYFDEEKEEENA